MPPPFGFWLCTRIMTATSGRVVRAVTCPPVDPLEAAADTFFTALVFTDADTDPTVDAAHLLGRIQGRELAERETPAEGAVLNESSAG